MKQLQKHEKNSSEITDTLSFLENSSFFRKTFFYTNRFEMHSEFLLSTLLFINFLNWPRRLNLFLKARFLETSVKKLWNLDNTSRSNPVNSCSYYSFRVPRKLYRKTSGRVATQSLSSVVNRILNDTQRSAGQFFSEQALGCNHSCTCSLHMRGLSSQKPGCADPPGVAAGNLTLHQPVQSK